MIKFHEKFLIESIAFEDVNPEHFRPSNYKFRNIHNIELTRFQIYPETELAYKYTKPLYKSRYSVILVEYEDGFDISTGKIIIHQMATSHSTTDENSYVPVKLQKKTGRIGGKLKPQDTDSTRLRELSLMNNTHFGAINYDIHLDMKLDYTISRFFQEMSLTELETLHHLCELERLEILLSFALAVLKIPSAEYLWSENRSNFIDCEGNILWYYTCTKKVSPSYVFEDKRCYKRVTILNKNKVHFVDTLARKIYF